MFNEKLEGRIGINWGIACQSQFKEWIFQGDSLSPLLYNHKTVHYNLIDRIIYEGTNSYIQ